MTKGTLGAGYKTSRNQTPERSRTPQQAVGGGKSPLSRSPLASRSPSPLGTPRGNAQAASSSKDFVEDFKKTEAELATLLGNQRHHFGETKDLQLLLLNPLAMFKGQVVFKKQGVFGKTQLTPQMIDMIEKRNDDDYDVVNNTLPNLTQNRRKFANSQKKNENLLDFAKDSINLAYMEVDRKNWNKKSEERHNILEINPYTTYTNLNGRLVGIKQAIQNNKEQEKKIGLEKKQKVVEQAMQSVEKLVKADSKLAIQHANPQFYEKICQSDAKNACKELFQQMDWNKADIKEILYDVTPGKLRSTKDSKGKIQHGLISDIRGTLKKFTENKTKNGQTYQQKYPQLKASTIKQAINALEEYYTASQAGNAAKQQQARYSQSPAPSRTQSPLPRGTAAPSTQEKGKEPARSTSSTQEKGKEFLQLQQQIQMYHSKQEELKNLQNLQKQLEGSGGRQGGQQLSLLEAFRQNQQKKPAQRVEIQPLQEFPTTTQAQLQGIGAEPKQDIKGEIKTTFGQVLNKLSNNDPNKQKLQAFYDDLSDGKNFEPDEIIGVKGTLVDIQKNTSDQDFKNSIDYLSEKLTLLPAEYNSSQKNQSNFSSGSDTPPALPILPSAHLTQQDTGQTSRGNPPTLPIHPLAHLTQQDTGQMSQAIVNMLPTLRELHTPPSTPLPSPRQGNRGANSSDSDSI